MTSRTDRDRTARALAASLCASTWTAPDLITCVTSTLPSGTVTLADATRIVRQLLAVHPTPLRVRPRALALELLGLQGIDEAYGLARTSGIPWRPRRHHVAPTRMAPLRWSGIPDLPNEGAVSHWLGLPLNELHWLADNQHRHRRVQEGPLQPYRATWVPRRVGPPRLIEAPSSLLKRLQRRIGALARTLGSHDAAYGFVPGRSPAQHAARHAGQRHVLTVDLRDFFSHITARRLFGLLITAGYPEAVAHLIAGLSTTATPIAVLRRMPAGGSSDQRAALRARLREPHLAQGSPSSPAWSNAVSFRLDRRLQGLAEAVGGV